MLFDNLDYEFFLPQHMFKKAKELSDEKVSLIRLSRPQLITIHNVPLLLLLGRLLKSLKYVKEKYFQVNIAVATYEMIDKHIRKLDSDLAKFESEMKVSSSVSSTSFTNQCVCSGQGTAVAERERGGGGGQQEEDEGQEEEGSQGGGQQEEEEGKEGEKELEREKTLQCFFLRLRT